MTPSTHQTPRRRGARIVAGIALAIVVSSCSGADDVSEPVEPNSTPPSDVTAPTTPAVEPTTSTTDPTTTTTSVAADPTTTIDSAPPTTNEGPPDTIYDPTTTEGQIEQALVRTAVAYIECLQLLPSCDADAVVDSAVGAYEQGVGAVLRQWITEGYEARDTELFSLQVEEVIVTPGESTSVAIACVEDRAIVFQPASATEPEVVIDDPAGWSWVRFQVDRINGAWFVSASEQLDTFSEDDAAGCA